MPDTHSETEPVVPLPAELSQCGCPYRPSRHYHTCQVAVAYDDRPLSERPEYELGRRFEAVSFHLPHRVTGTLHIDVELDIEAVIKANRDRYLRFEADDEWEAWEKPLAFVWDTVTEAWSGVYFPGRRRNCRDGSYFDYDYSRRGRQGWNPDDTERLHAWLDSPVNDPNQPELPL